MEQAPLMLTQQQKTALDNGFFHYFQEKPTRYFSAPGRTELGGNHTDHQRGKVLAAAVNLDMLAAVRENGTKSIRILSQGYPINCVALTELEPQQEERNTTKALIRGVAAGFVRLGCEVKGFDAYIESTVLPGSGLSSSAAFEVLMGTIINSLFFDEKMTQLEIAQIGQYAENVFFGKPCGLMDQTACAVGGMVAIDFKDKEKPLITPVDFDFDACGHVLCIVNTGASHADLTGEYAAITQELQAVSHYFGKEVVSEIPKADLLANLADLRKACGDRAVLRAIHVHQENQRVEAQIEAIKDGDFEKYLSVMKESGDSSYMYLQNVIPTGGICRQDVAIALALSRELLQGNGGYRVHGGGFAGTVQAFVPIDRLEKFRQGMDTVLGEGACHVLRIRPQGGVEVFADA